jgi:hypothetical protein
VPRNDVNHGYFFLNKKKRYVIAKEERLNILLLSNAKKEIASYLAMTLIQVDSFLIVKRYVIAKEEGLKQSFDLEYPLMRLLRTSQ